MKKIKFTLILFFASTLFLLWQTTGKRQALSVGLSPVDVQPATVSGAEVTFPLESTENPRPAVEQVFIRADGHAGDCGCRPCVSHGEESLQKIELVGGFGSWVADWELRGRLELPGGKVVPVVVEQREVGDDGLPVMVGGRTEAPAGRFLFRRELVDGVAAPMWGFVTLAGEDTAYRVENEGGRSFLAEAPADLVLCRQFAPPPAEAVAAAEGEVELIPADHPTDLVIPAYQNGIIPLQSLPGAAGVVYLDLDGEKGPFEGWGSFDAAAYTLTTAQVKEVWQRVAEDFTPFNINVTTDLQVFLRAPGNSRQRCIVTPTDTAYPGAGGVAYVGSFSSSGDQPCWAYIGSGKFAAEVISHEVGHTLGLSHDGRISPAETYYGGQGTDPVGWAPIMGVGYYRNLTQWSKGEYTSANQTQDDLAIIDNNNSVDYRADDTTATLATAAYLEIQSNNAVTGQGILATRDDVDAYRFKTSGGSVTLNVNPVAAGPNLDILAEIRNSSNVVVASANPATALNASLTATLAAGEYTLQVSGVGRGDPLVDGYSDYATLGAYTITGSVSGGEKPDRFSIAENAASGTAVGTVVPRLNHGTNRLSYAISSATVAGAFTIDSASGQLKVADQSKCDYEAWSTFWDDPATCEVFVAITDSVNATLNESVRVVVSLTNVNEPPVLTGGSVQTPAGTRAGTALVQVAAIDPDQFQQASSALPFSITAGNANGWFAIDPATGWVSVAVPPAAGNHVLTVQGGDSSGSATTTVTINAYAIPSGYSPGVVYHTIYDNITGSTVASLTSSAKFPASPDREVALGELTDTTRGDNYGSTVRAWVLPPVSGSYTFWIAGADDCQLLLSNTADPAGATVRASVSGYTNYQSWTKYVGQKSAAISLTAGQAYYLEVRHKEATVDDHVAVAWQASVGTTVAIPQQVIPGRFLAPHVINHRPLIASSTAQLYETAYNGATAALVAASDANQGQTLTYAITAGNSAGAFGIDRATGRIHVADRTKLSATATPAYSLTVSATDDATPPLSGTGIVTIQVLTASQVATTQLVHELWDNITGSTLANLYSSSKWPNLPDRVRRVSALEASSNIGDNFGARVRGCVIPPASGSYNFYLASDGEGALWLSSDATPANAKLVASVPTASSARTWTTFSSQKSAAVNLVAGQRYYVEARLKEGTGNDHIAVGWTGPGITTVTVPSGSQVAPYDSNLAPVFAATSYSWRVDAAAAAGTTVGTVAATSPACEETTYAILSGNPGGFAIDPRTGRVFLANPAAVTPGLTYSLQVGAQDDGLCHMFAPKAATATVAIEVIGEIPNQAPVVRIIEPSAASVNLAASTGLMLTASVSDDGKPAGAAPGVTWTTVSGPGGARFSPSSGPITGATFPATGTYVLRATASDGVLTSSADLTVSVGSSGTAPVVDAGPDTTLPLIGGNLAGSVSGGNVSATDSTVYIERGTAGWRLRKGTSEASSPVDAWRVLSFSENSTWLDATPLVGYGTAYSAATPLTDMKGGYTSVYFRRSFDIDPARIPDELTLELFVDDGAIVWINGVEVARRYVGTGQKAYNATANKDRTAVWETLTIPNARSFLVGGSNMLAIHGFNRGKANADFAFNAALSTKRLPGAALTRWSLVSGPGSVAFDDPALTNTPVSFSANGTYVLRLGASDGSVSVFDDVTVTVSADPGDTSKFVDQQSPHDLWLAKNFAERADDPLVAGDDADPDHDGSVNLLEYALGLDPWAADPAADMPHVERADGELAFVYRRNLAATDLLWVVERSRDLGSGDPWAPADVVSEEILSDDDAVRLIRARVEDGGEPSLFLRLAVDRQR